MAVMLSVAEINVRVCFGFVYFAKIEMFLLKVL